MEGLGGEGAGGPHVGMGIEFSSGEGFGMFVMSGGLALKSAGRFNGVSGWTGVLDEGAGIWCGWPLK